MRAPAPFAVMLANASIHGRARPSRRVNVPDVDAGLREHDDLEERVDAYLAAGPLPGREIEYEIVSQVRDLDDRMKEVGRLVASCNIISARMVGRLELAASEHHAWEVEHAR